MDGFGAALESAIMGMVLIAFVAGGAIAIGGYFFFSWLFAHLSVGWA